MSLSNLFKKLSCCILAELVLNEREKKILNTAMEMISLCILRDFSTLHN